MRNPIGRSARPVLLCVLGLFLSAGPGAAQRTQTLLGRDFESGGFGGPMVQIMPVGDGTALFVGGRGGWIINHTFSIGGGGWGLVNELSTSVTDTAADNTRLMVGYGGVIFEYTARSYELVHYGASLMVGWGSADYVQGGSDLSGGTPFFVLEPAVQAELNVTDFFRIALGASWRYTEGIDLEGFTDDDMKQVAGVVTFKFGSF